MSIIIIVYFRAHLQFSESPDSFQRKHLWMYIIIIVNTQTITINSYGLYRVIR